MHKHESSTEYHQYLSVKQIERYLLALLCIMGLFLVTCAVMAVSVVSLSNTGKTVVHSYTAQIPPETVNVIVEKAAVIADRTAEASGHFPNIAESADRIVGRYNNKTNTTFVEQAAAYSSDVMYAVDPSSIAALMTSTAGAAKAVAEFDFAALSDLLSDEGLREKFTTDIERLLDDADGFLEGLQRMFKGFGAMGAPVGL